MPGVPYACCSYSVKSDGQLIYENTFLKQTLTPCKGKSGNLNCLACSSTTFIPGEPLVVKAKEPAEGW